MTPLLRRISLILLVMLLAVAGISGRWLLGLDRQITERMSSRQWALPARVFARPIELYPGKSLSRRDLLTELDWLGYRLGAAIAAGNFEPGENALTLHTRGFTFAEDIEPARRVKLIWSADRISAVEVDRSVPGVPDAITGAHPKPPTDAPTAVIRLEPLEIGAIHPTRHQDRILLSAEALPTGFVNALTTVEDRQFFAHHGISLRGIVRAAWTNLRTGSRRQGASTLTQQLVKNLFLTSEKTWSRKLTEACMALIMEWRYSKETILETFVNEVFIAQDGDRAIHGFGLASQYFFGRPMQELLPHQYALLIGMLKAPSAYNPVRRSDAAKRRRDLVLRLMHEAELLDASDYAAALEQELGIDASYRRGGNPAYLDAVKRQLLRDYQLDALQSDGLRVFTSFDPLVQRALETSVEQTLSKLQQQYGSTALAADFLEVAAVVTDPNTGDIRAMLGGRNSRYSGFNRALDARRPVGSLLKPAIYLTALQQPANFTLATLLDDEPIELPQRDGSVWRPENFSGTANGKVTLLEALSRSLNLASVNLGLTLGLDQVIETLEDLGINQPLPEIPALLLGAHGFTAMDMTRVYQTLAADGFTIPLSTIREVLDAGNQRLSHFPIEVTRKFDGSSSYLLKYAMTEAMRVGTGRSAYRTLPGDFTVAGKTGTSDDQRDSWFAGYSGDTLAVIWLGNDGNAKTPLTGSSGALQIWTDLISQVSQEPVSQTPPSDIVWQATDLASGRRVIGQCSSAPAIPYMLGSEPTRRTRCRSPTRSNWLRSLINRR